MHTPADTTAPACHAPADAGPPMTARRRRWKLTVHYLEMVVAMAVGMVALHPVWTFALDAVGWSGFLDHPEAMTMVMATNMTIAMTAWMRFRGHALAAVRGDGRGDVPAVPRPVRADVARPDHVRRRVSCGGTC